MQPDTTLSSANPAVREYIANLTQASTEPPTAVVLKNTLGFTPLWIYDSVGNYSILNDLFTVAKTAAIIRHVLDNGPTTAQIGVIDGTVYIETSLNNTPANDCLIDATIYIQVFN